MGREPGVSWSKQHGCWSTNALGEVKVTPAGRKYRPKTLFKELTKFPGDRRQAVLLLESRLAEQTANLRPIGDPTLDQLQEWYLEAAEKTLGPDSYDLRIQHLDRVLGWPAVNHPQRIGAIRARDLKAESIQEFLDALAASGKCSEIYLKDSLLKSVKRLMAWACEVKAGVYFGLPLAVNPLATVKGPAVPRRALREMSDEQSDALMKFLYRRALRDSGVTRRFGMITALLIYTLRQTGARPKELCVTEWSDLTIGEDGWGLITLPYWKHKTGRKTKRDRYIALSPQLVKRFERVRKLEGRHQSFIFTHRRGRGRGQVGTMEAGEPWVWVDHESKRSGNSKMLQQWFLRVRKEAEAAGLSIPEGFRMYWQRSGYSTAAKRKGVPSALIANAMGTSEVMLEQNYTDLAAGDALDMAKRMGKSSKGD